MLNTLRTWFPRPVRAALYTAAAAGDTALVAAHQLPAWTLPVVLPLLLALLHLTPGDVDAPPAKNDEGSTAVVVAVSVAIIATVMLLSWFGIHGHR